MSIRTGLATCIASLLTALAVAAPAAADPVTRVISPAGAGIECSVANPCSYQYATTIGSNAGDTVLALPGTYIVTGSPVTPTHQLTIMGDPHQPRPIFENLDTVASWAIYLSTGTDGTVLRHLEIRGFHGLWSSTRLDASDLAVTASSYCVALIGDGSAIGDSTLTIENPKAPNCLKIQGASTARRMTIDATGGVGVLLLSGGATVEDSTVTADSPVRLVNPSANSTIRRVTLDATKTAVSASQSGVATISDSLIRTSGAAAAIDTDRGGHLTLRNDTILAPAAGATGLLAEAQFQGVLPGVIAVRNSIVDASTTDLNAQLPVDASKCTPLPCLPGQLTADHTAFGSTSGPLTDGGSNVTGDPLFVDGAFGDFHLRPGSPAIDAGAADPFTSSTDFDGHPRVQGAAVDLGAFEAPAPPAAAAPPTGDSPPAAPTPPAADPGLVADLTAPVLSGLRVKLPATLSYRSSEAAGVTITLARRGAKNHFRRLASVTRKAIAGANRTKLMKARSLKPGSYRVTLTARDAAGNNSKTATVRFTIPRATPAAARG